MWYPKTFKDWNTLGDPITRVTNETGRSTGSVEGHDGLEGDVHILNLESLKHYGYHLFTVGPGVKWGFGEKNTFCFFRCKSEFFVKSVVPNLLHVLPGLDDTCSDGLLQVENASFLHGLVTYIF